MNELASEPGHVRGTATDIATVDVARRLTRPMFARGFLVLVAIATGLEVAARPATFAVPSISNPALHAVLALIATFALYAWTARASGRRSAIYSVIVLATMPAWFVRARVDASLPMVPTIVLACLGLATHASIRRLRRALLVAVAVLCSVLAVRAAGLAVVLLIPALAIGAGHLIERSPRRGTWQIVLGGSVLIIAGVLAARSSDRLAGLLLGPPPISGSAGVTAVVTRIAYGSAPWAPLLAFSLARRPRAGRGRVGLLLAAVLGLAFEAVHPSSGTTWVAGALAATIGTTLAELDHETHPSPLLAAGVIAIGGIVAHDLSLSADRVLDVIGSSLPAGHAGLAARSLRVAIWSTTGAMTFVTVANKEWLDIRVLPRPFGRVVFGRGLVVIVVGLLAGGVLRMHAYPDLLRRISPGRAFETWLERKSPGDALALFAVDRSRWLNAAGRATPAETDGLAEREMNAPESATTWLLEGPESARRFLAIGPSGLARVNAAYRAKRGENLPVVAGEGAFILAVNRLADGERSENPLDAIVRASAPSDLRPMTAPVRLGDALDVLGWGVVDASGHPLAAMPRRKSARVRIAIRVGVKPHSLSGYCTFIHIDHSPTRFGAEHREHVYAMNLWREGDVILDDFEVDLPPHFGAGTYPLYWGVGRLPCQDDRRMPITSGPNDGHDRVPLGRLEVR